MPFDTFSDGGSAGEKEKQDGKVISDLLSYELQRISNIHNQEIREVPIKIPQTKYMFKTKFDSEEVKLQEVIILLGIFKYNLELVFLRRVIFS